MHWLYVKFAKNSLPGLDLSPPLWLFALALNLHCWRLNVPYETPESYLRNQLIGYVSRTSSTCSWSLSSSLAIRSCTHFARHNTSDLLQFLIEGRQTKRPKTKKSMTLNISFKSRSLRVAVVHALSVYIVIFFLSNHGGILQDDVDFRKFNYWNSESILNKVYLTCNLESSS